MLFDIVFTAKSQEDLEEIKIYYSNILEGLEDKFLSMMEARITALAITPAAASVRYEMFVVH